MFLSKIELVGFKSFANKTSLNFDGGITAIIGPNGCGKTNIVDAVRWVLGEQRTSILRSELMENVIFNGSSTRKPLGMAEVSITFQNDKGVLPIQYNELTITRRLYRDGKSEYLLNNNLCRLKDISELFADTGIGHNSYSIIELKMVESLLNGTVEERRKLLEEAAGISKYKQRKKETTRKLETVQNDLLRIYDLVNEIEAQVRSLSRQATKMRKYNKLYQELKELELNSWFLKFSHSNEIITKLEEENIKISLETQQKRELLDQILEELSNLQFQIDDLESELENVRYEESQIHRELSELEKKVGLENERIVNLNSLEKKLQNEINDIGNMIERYNKTLSELRRLEELKLNESSKIDLEINEIYLSYEKNQKQLQEKRYFLSDINDKRIVLDRDIKVTKLNLDKLISSLNQLEEKKARILSAINELELKISEKSKYISALEIEVASIYNQVETTRQQISDFEEALQTSNDILKNEKDKYNQIMLSLKEVQTSLELLNSIFEVDETTKFLIKDSEWKADREFNLLGEIIPIEEQYRVAFDSLLGQFKNVIMVQTQNDILRAKEILSKEHKGKCFFVALDSIPESSIEIHFQKHPKIIAFACELPNVDNKIRNLLRILLGDSAIVKNFDDALDVARELSLNTVVTLSGEMIVNGIVYKRGSVYQGEGLAIGKLERIKKLETKYIQLVQELKNAEIIIDNLEKENKNKFNEFRKQKNLLMEEENKLNKKKSILNDEKIIFERLKQELISKQGILNEIDDEKNKISNEISLAKKVLNEKQEKLVEIEKIWQDQKLELKALETNYEKENQRYQELEKESVRLKTEIEGLNKEKQRLKNSEKQNENRISTLCLELRKLERERNEKFQLLNNLNEDRNRVENKLKEVISKKNLLIEKKKELEENLTQQEEHKESIQKAIEKTTAKLHQNELEITRHKEIAHSLFAKAMENYQVNLNDWVLSFDYENVSSEQIDLKISELKKSLNSLGNVNFLALQEYEEKNERLEHYKKQIKDLVNSEKSLKEALKEIDDTAEKKFLQTFTQVNENFNKVFKELFGSDSFAELVINDNDPLESDIEIRVKPAGKKVHSIETLSQGEKTLTVLSLLFALYLVKPSPFCILDEVDAPLDDANVDRFLTLLKKFSKDVQFILITHNKRTMEFANLLYGVTMADDGVSKILSVKLVE